MVGSLIIGNFPELYLEVPSISEGPAGPSPCVALAPGWPVTRVVQLEVLDTQEIPVVNQS